MNDQHEGLREEPAPHYRGHWQRVAPLVRPAMADQGPLSHLAGCSDGVLDFAVDAPGPAAAPADPTLPETLRRTDQQVSFSAAQLDRRLAETRSGNLIRTVLQNEQLAYFCDNVVPGVDLLGVQLLDPARAQPDTYPERAPEAERGDRKMAEIVRTLRQQVGLGSTNPGGFDEDTGDIRVPSDDSPGAVHVSGDQDDPRAAGLRDALRVDGLHYLAYCRYGERRFTADLLDDPQLDQFFTLIDARTRRRFYHALAEGFGAVVSRFHRNLHGVTEVPLTRVVLDVEQGAIFYFRIRRGEYLIGVTMHQRRVGRADQEANQLADAYRRDPP